METTIRKLHTDWWHKSCKIKTIELKLFIGFFEEKKEHRAKQVTKKTSKILSNKNESSNTRNLANCLNEHTQGNLLLGTW
jgi:hypothetical protein